QHDGFVGGAVRVHRPRDAARVDQGQRYVCARQRDHQRRHAEPLMRRSEEGFTLAELLISTVILAVIFGVITEAMIVGLRTSDKTNQRVRESVDAQFVSVYFPRDAQAAKQVATGTVDACSNQVSVASFSWPDPADATVTKRAAYVLGSASAD